MKLVLHALHESGVHVPEISIPVSLGVICAVLVVTTITSLYASRKAEAAEKEKKDADVSTVPSPAATRGGDGAARTVVVRQHRRAVLTA